MLGREVRHQPQKVLRGWQSRWLWADLGQEEGYRLLVWVLVVGLTELTLSLREWGLQGDRKRDLRWVRELDLQQEGELDLQQEGERARQQEGERARRQEGERARRQEGERARRHEEELALRWEQE